MSFLGELRRRNVLRVGAAYLVTAWLVLQVADVVFPAIEAPPWAMKAVLALLLLGLPLALAVAWVFELTPAGLQRTREVDASQSVTRETGRKLNYAIIAILVLAIGVLLYDRLRAPPRVDAAPAAAVAAVGQSIAVLPFVNMSADPENEYFSDGLSEELLNVLAKVDGLKVAARTSSFNFKGVKADIAEIGAALGVATVLEGSVRKTADRVRITAQLINVEDGFHLWSETYDRSLENIFEVQDEIAGAIVAALKLPLLGTATASVAAHGSTSIEAYDLYLLGRHRVRETNAASLRQAIDYFQRAIAADPGYAPAHSGLADAYLLLANYGDMPQVEAHAAAATAIDRALALDPELAEAWTSRASLEEERNQPRQSLESVRKAIELNPSSSTALLQQAVTLLRLGRARESLASAARALELDPLSDFVRQQYLVYLARAGSGAEALQHAREWAAREPQNPYPFEAMGEAYFQSLRQPQRAIPAFARAHELRPGDTYMARHIVEAFLDLDDLPSAKHWLDKARERGARAQHTEVAEFLIAYFQGDATVQEGLLQRHLRTNPDSELALGALARSRIEAGQLDLAEQVVRRQLELLNDDPDLPMVPAAALPAVRLAVIHQRRDETAELGRWLGRLEALRDVLLAEMPDSRSGHLLAARIASLRGDREAMLDALRAGVQRGYRAHWRLLLEPEFAPWREDRLFKAFVAEQRRQNAALLAELARSPDGPALMGRE